MRSLVSCFTKLACIAGASLLLVGCAEGQKPTPLKRLERGTRAADEKKLPPADAKPDVAEPPK